MNARIFIFSIFGLFAVIISIWLGAGLAQNQVETLLITGGVVGLLVCLLVGQKIWIVMMMLIAMEVPIIRGFFTEDLGQAVFIAMSVVIFMMRKLKLNWTFTEMDFWRFLLAACIVQVYIRNPVGLNILGASSVGARPYFIAALSLLSGFILSKYIVQPKEIRWAMWLSIIGSLITMPINTWRYGLNRGPVIESVQVTAGYQGEGAGRVGSYNTWAQSLSVIISSRINPLRGCIHPVWAVLILLTLAFAALSGYRNTVGYVGITFLLGIAYRGGLISMITSFVLGAFSLGALAVINLAYPLPATAQRALSPFPGTWETRHTEAAERSTEWRIEMWKAALFTDEWIQNKLLGDGIGMTREEFERMQELDSRKGSRAIGTTLTRQQEGMMLTGNYHSGPVQTVRTIGYAGLLIMWAAMIRMMVHMHRLITISRNTEWFIPVLFFGIPIMGWPIFWTFIFGEFRTGVFYIFFWSGFIDLLRKNLPLEPWVHPKHRPRPTISQLNPSDTNRRRAAAPFNA